MIEEWIDYFPVNSELTKTKGLWKNHSDHRDKLLLRAFLVFYQIQNNYLSTEKNVYHQKGEKAS